MSLLITRGLVVEAGGTGGPGVALLRGLNLTVERGQAVALVAEGGAGGALVGPAIAGLLPPDCRMTDGVLEFDGADLASMPPQDRRALMGREIAFLPGDPTATLDPARMIAAQIEDHHRRLGQSGRRALRDAARTTLAAAGLEDADTVLASRPAQLSPETCMRVHIAMAFAAGPRLLVAEEPTAMLDMPAQARVIRLLQTLRAAHGTALLLITGDLRLAAAVCTEVAVLYAGDIVESGPASEVLQMPRHPYTRCLGLASPMVEGPREALYVLPEQMPGARSLAQLTGCRFAPRCAVKADYCLRSEPPLEGDRHRSACLRSGLVASIVSPGPLPMPPWRPVGERPVLELERVSKAFPVRRGWRLASVPALREVSLRVAPGEFVAVVGEHGCGKSTLLRVAAGLDAPDQGRVLHDGRIAGPGGAARPGRGAPAVQMVFRDRRGALNPRLRVSDIVTQALVAQRARSRSREKRARELLAEMGMALEIGVRSPAQLSEGQLLRVALARALCAAPKLLVADDMFLGLDATVRAQVIMLLHRLRQQHEFALLVACRDLAVARHLCDRVVVLDQGSIAEDGLADTVIGWPRHPKAALLVAAEPR